ncbi:hypothetical protein GCM10018952_48310 [Streptosporangium vulgare]
MHLLHVRHDGGPPAGPLGLGGGTGVHEERQVALGEHVEQRGDPGQARGVAHGGGGQLEADEPRPHVPHAVAVAVAVAVAHVAPYAVSRVEGLGEPGGVDLAEAGRRPGAEGRGQREGVLVVGVDDRPRLAGGQ